MINKLAIGLCIVFLSAYTPIGELWHLPQLIEHYNQHRTEEGISLAEFITLHYGNCKHCHSDKSLDRLPFKSHHFSLDQIQNTAIVVSPFELENQLTETILDYMIFFKLSLYYNYCNWSSSSGLVNKKESIFEMDCSNCATGLYRIGQFGQGFSTFIIE